MVNEFNQRPRLMPTTIINSRNNYDTIIIAPIAYW